MSKNILSFIILCSIFILAGSEILWEADFSVDGELNWKKVRSSEKDRFEIKDGVLIAECANAPYKGSLYEIKLPSVERGSIVFEVNINPDSQYNNLSLIVRFCQSLTAFRPKLWTRYIEKRGSKQLGAIGNGQWYHCKISFDRKKNTIAYYINDMSDPVASDTGVEFPAELTLQIGNYGLATGMITNRIRNLKMLKREETEESIGGPMIFRGMSFEAYDLEGFAAILSKIKPRTYTLEVKPGLLTENHFALDKVPRKGSVADCIIMADMPVGKVLSEDVQEIIENSVKNGATLIVLGGMFTLNKGDFKDTLLEKMLPVELESPWAVAKLDAPAVFDVGYKLFYLHDLKIRDHAQVKKQINGKNFIISGNYGKGKVVVSLGIPAGDLLDGEKYFGLSGEFNQLIIDAIKHGEK